MLFSLHTKKSHCKKFSLQYVNSYRGVDKPTDVLSFPMYDGEFPYEECSLGCAIGDIVISLERAEEQIQLEKKQALNDVKNEVSAMAIGIASAVIERDVSESEHRALIDDFINNIGNE